MAETCPSRNSGSVQCSKGEGPVLGKAPSSKLYKDTKRKIDNLIERSGLAIVQHVYNSYYPYEIGYYYQDELVFKYERLTIKGGHDPKITYWDDFHKYPNDRKESLHCCSDKDCHTAFSDKDIIGIIKHLIDQIKVANKRI